MNELAEEYETECDFERLLFQRDLFGMARDLLGYQDLSWNTHRDMIWALQAPTLRKLIVMPRGTFKSSICSVAYPIWLLLSNPNLRILLDSELYTNSKNFLREIAQHLEGEPLTSRFGTFKSRIWNEGELIISQRTKVLKEATLTASGIGAEKTGQHYDVIIMDDLNSPKNSSGPELQDKVIEHYRYNLAILEPNGIMVVVATRYSANDVPGVILRTEAMRQKQVSEAEAANKPLAENAIADTPSSCQSTIFLST